MPRIYRPNEVVPINPGGLLGIQIPGAPPGIICDGRPIAWDADPPTKTNKDTSSLECGFEWQTFSRTSRELKRDALIFFWLRKLQEERTEQHCSITWSMSVYSDARKRKVRLTSFPKRKIGCVSSSGGNGTL